ncbi:MULTISPECIES: glycerol-3-phosphate 1-O-acyltransferase PlsY [unclassified Fusibacter]|uniref:glycerol-3-phosphate 1-O-acyltransferase PlsY n=1 Tax=unclassified Fusibacter TaxID=2624464 RepID=UPI0010125C6E|nr:MULTISPECIES: glycerol-3-phosphate 1-O-acyltransferase PlsY [unclassified Fusibacter]MCK8058099.1 glycerol-3-phosphate 1-O-acyltransferase PlsY [Fusibacter sp. A2]NPE20681.1 glycerol-3-phosphate 1-O-acyltransferase PlsY [Fusibacter sp. A1]RXV62887.1 glycerol-3-phosphate 1-O-acyltransferase [Fusibacter sp. A1]
MIYAIVLGYLIGSIPFSFVVPKLLKKVDIRTVGSGNVGATNVYRICGAKGALVAFLGDILKGIAAVIVASNLWGYEAGLIAGVFSMIGHCYSYMLGFKGGKGVTTAAGIVLVVNPVIFVSLLLFMVMMIGTTRIVSLSSILGAMLLPVLAILLKTTDAFILFSFIMSLFVIYRHKSNIGRLLRGEESRFGQKKTS